MPSKFGLFVTQRISLYSSVPSKTAAPNDVLAFRHHLVLNLTRNDDAVGIATLGRHVLAIYVPLTFVSQKVPTVLVVLPNAQQTQSTRSSYRLTFIQKSTLIVHSPARESSYTLNYWFSAVRKYTIWHERKVRMTQETTGRRTSG